MEKQFFEQAGKLDAWNYAISMRNATEFVRTGYHLAKFLIEKRKTNLQEIILNDSFSEDGQVSFPPGDAIIIGNQNYSIKLLLQMCSQSIFQSAHSFFDYLDVAKDKRDIISFFRDSAISGSVDEVFPSLAQEWDIVLNEGLLPSNIPATYSKDKYYWKCKKCGYSWSASLGERIRGSGCPVCAGKVIVPGINDLATTHKWLAEEWHPNKNKPLTPQEVSKGSSAKVWWKCSKCGNEWAVRIKNRVNGAGCPKCSNKRRAKQQYKPVYQFALDDTLVEEYPSARIAATETGLSRSAIQHACTGRLKTAGGYIWKYSLE